MFWDQLEIDDREFDEGDERRMELPEYATAVHPGPMAYGLGLPRDLRVRLAIYRLSVEDFSEALVSIEPEPRDDIITTYPFCLLTVVETASSEVLGSIPSGHGG